MSIIYNRLYKVPNWIVLNLDDEKKAQDLVEKFKKEGVHEVKWISKEFPITINEMARKGWWHEVNKPMPFIANVDFLMVAITQHIKKYGLSKTLSGTPEKSVASINRKIINGDDYVRIFNAVLENEPDVTLSHIFGIGELCNTDRSKIQTFITIGPVAKKVLQKVSDRVITIEVSQNVDEAFVVEGCEAGDSVIDVIDKVI